MSEAPAHDAAASPPSRSPWLRRGLAVAGYALIALLAFRKLEPGTLERGVRSLSLWSLALVLCVSLLHIAARTLRFHWLLLRARPRGYRLADGATIFLIGLSSSAVTPARAGDLIKAKLVGAHGVPASTGVGLVIAERLLDLLALTTTMLIAWPLVGRAAVGARASAWGYAALALLALELAVVLVLALPAGRRAWQRALLAAVGRLGGAERRARIEVVSNQFVSFWEEVFSSWARGVALLGFSLLAWSVEFLKLWLVLRLMGDGVSPTLVLFAYPASLLAGILSLVPFSEGVVGVTVVAILQQLGGLDPSRATVAVVVDRAASLLPPLVLAGLFSLSRARPRAGASGGAP